MTTEFKYIIRLFGSDLDGTRKVVHSLADLKGVGQNLSHYLLTSMNIDSNMRLGNLTDKQVADIEMRLKDFSNLGLPEFLMNRRKDLESGSDIHIVGSNIDLFLRNDRERERLTMSWRGIRHSLGLKLRGQRTRTSGRKGKTIGVKKSSLMKPKRE